MLDDTMLNNIGS